MASQKGAEEERSRGSTFAAALCSASRLSNQNQNWKWKQEAIRAVLSLCPASRHHRPTSAGRLFCHQHQRPAEAQQKRGNEKRLQFEAGPNASRRWQRVQYDKLSQVINVSGPAQHASWHARCAIIY